MYKGEMMKQKFLMYFLSYTLLFNATATIHCMQTQPEIPLQFDQPKGVRLFGSDKPITIDFSKFSLPKIELPETHLKEKISEIEFKQHFKEAATNFSLLLTTIFRGLKSPTQLAFKVSFFITKNWWTLIKMAALFATIILAIKYRKEIKGGYQAVMGMLSTLNQMAMSMTNGLQGVIGGVAGAGETAVRSVGEAAKVAGETAVETVQQAVEAYDPAFEEVGAIGIVEEEIVAKAKKTEKDIKSYSQDHSKMVDEINSRLSNEASIKELQKLIPDFTSQEIIGAYVKDNPEQVAELLAKERFSTIAKDLSEYISKQIELFKKCIQEQ